MDIRELQDDDLRAYAREWRQRALRGEKDARGLAHELEREVRRRFPPLRGTPRTDTDTPAWRHAADHAAALGALVNAQGEKPARGASPLGRIR